jgi:hypothetical protein
LHRVTSPHRQESTDSSSAVDVEARPLEEVLDSPIVVTADPSGTSATVTLTTTIPLACAAIYGEDDDFGMVATDADAAGDLYRSEVLPFSTPEATGVARPGTDVAAHDHDRGTTGRVPGHVRGTVDRRNGRPRREALSDRGPSGQTRLSAATRRPPWAAGERRLPRPGGRLPVDR